MNDELSVSAWVCTHNYLVRLSMFVPLVLLHLLSSFAFGQYTSCSAIKAANTSSTSGIYTVNGFQVGYLVGVIAKDILRFGYRWRRFPIAYTYVESWTYILLKSNNVRSILSRISNLDSRKLDG